jgi:hypothetical protein
MIHVLDIKTKRTIVAVNTCGIQRWNSPGVAEKQDYVPGAVFAGKRRAKTNGKKENGGGIFS